MWRIGTANRPMQLTIKDWFCNWLFMKLFCEKKSLWIPSNTSWIWQGTVSSSLSLKSRSSSLSASTRVNLDLVLCGKLRQSCAVQIFWIPGFLRVSSFCWTSWKDETHVHAKHLKRTTQWYLKWFWEVSQVLTALAWRCTQRFPVFLCVLGPLLFKGRFSQMAPLLPRFRSSKLLVDPKKVVKALEPRNGHFWRATDDWWHAKMVVLTQAIFRQWWDPAPTVRPNKKSTSALANPQNIPTFHNHACRMMPILTKDAYPNYGMVTGGGGTMWDNHQTESFKKPRSVPLHLHLDRSDIAWCPAAPSASEICNSLKGHLFIRKQGSVPCIPCENIWN